MISANDFYVDIDDVEELDDKEIIALSNAQAWDPAADELISIAKVEYSLEKKKENIRLLSPHPTEQVLREISM